MEERIEKLWVKAFGGEHITFAQDADGIMAVQAFLMAGDNAKIADADVRLQLLMC